MAFDRKAYMKAYRKKHSKGVGKGNGKRKEKPKIIVGTMTPKKEKQEDKPIEAIKINLDKMEIENEVNETETETQKQETETPTQKAETIETETIETENSKDDSETFFKDINAEYKSKETETTETNETTGTGNEEKAESIKAEEIPSKQNLMISGYMFLIALNIVYPELLLGMMGMFSKKYRKIKGEDIALDETQMGMMEEIANEFVKVYLPKINPMVLFLVCYNGMMLGNIKKEMRKNLSIDV